MAPKRARSKAASRSPSAASRSPSRSRAEAPRDKTPDRRGSNASAVSPEVHPASRGNANDAVATGRDSVVGKIGNATDAVATDRGSIVGKIGDAAGEEASERSATNLEMTSAATAPDGPMGVTELETSETRALKDEAPESSSEQALLAAFRVLDTNGDGFVSEEEFTSVLSTLGVPESEVVVMFQAADANASGFVDYANFLSWVHKAPEEIQAGMDKLIDVDGRRGKVVWDGRPTHGFVQVEFFDSGSREMLKIEKAFPGQKWEPPADSVDAIVSKTAQLDDQWKAFQKAFDDMTKELVNKIGKDMIGKDVNDIFQFDVDKGPFFIQFY